jgi:hypothetical protein
MAENAFSMSTKKAGDSQAGTRGVAAEERPGCAPRAPLLKLVPFFPTFFSFYDGEVAEWLKALVSKTSIGVSLSRVRIPPSPQNFSIRSISNSLPITDFSACPNHLHLYIIRSLFKCAVESEYPARNPASKLEMLRIASTGRPDVSTDKEILESTSLTLNGWDPASASRPAGFIVFPRMLMYRAPRLVLD